MVEDRRWKKEGEASSKIIRWDHYLEMETELIENFQHGQQTCDISAQCLVVYFGKSSVTLHTLVWNIEMEH